MVNILDGFFILPLILEGLGIVFNYQAIWFYLPIPIFLYIVFILKKKQINQPPILSITYGLFLIFSLVSALNFSLDKERSFSLWLFFLTCYLIFIYFYNHKEEAKKLIKLTIFIASPVFILTALAKHFDTFSWLRSIPKDGYNLFYSVYVNHNHLGDFLPLLIIYFFYQYLDQKKTRYVIASTLLILLVVFSFSRSAYLALFFTLIIFLLFKKTKIEKKRPIFVLVGLLAVFLIILFFAVSRPVLINYSVGRWWSGLTNNLKIPQKDPTGSRPIYFNQALVSIKENPLFGVGPGNFIYASLKYRKNIVDFAETSTNIFLDFLVEHGLLAFLPLAIFFIVVLKSAIAEQAAYALMFIYLLFNFQTDYTFKIYSLFLLFIILGASFYKEKSEPLDTALYGLFSALVFLIGLAMIVDNLLFFPLNKKFYQDAINQEKEKGNYTKAINLANKYNQLFADDPVSLYFLAKFYEDIFSQQKALSYYEKIYQNNSYISFDVIKRIYQLKKDLYGDGIANNFFNGYINFYNKNKQGFSQEELKNNFYNFCLFETRAACPLRYFYEPDPKTTMKDTDKPYHARYTINKDALNERYDYSAKKEPGTFRIITLGDSFTFGLYTDTTQNWTESLEDIINHKNNCKNIKKFEVINLAFSGYDPRYTVERYLRRGKKYNADLIIWPLRIYYLNSLREQIRQRVEEDKLKRGLGESTDQLWDEARKKVIDELSRDEIYQRQEKYFMELAKIYKNKVVLVDIDQINNDLKKRFLPTNQNFFWITIVPPDENYYHETGMLNLKGNQVFAQKIYDYLMSNPLNNCQR